MFNFFKINTKKKQIMAQSSLLLNFKLLFTSYSNSCIDLNVISLHLKDINKTLWQSLSFYFEKLNNHET